MLVAGIGIVVNAATALMFMRGRAHDLNIAGVFTHMAGDAALSFGVVVAAFSDWRYRMALARSAHEHRPGGGNLS
jgi:Co/Zn/Cd efflux system component